MQIFITRGEDSNGPFTLEQVQDCLDQGTLLPDDLAYHEGLEDWIPLSELMNSISTPASTPSAPSTEKPSIKRCIVMGVLAFLFMASPAGCQLTNWMTDDRFQLLKEIRQLNVADGETSLPTTEFCISITDWFINNISIAFPMLFILLVFFSIFMGGKRLYLSKKTCKWTNFFFWFCYMGFWLVYVISMFMPLIVMMDNLGQE